MFLFFKTSCSTWDVDDGVLVDSRDDELAGEWADGADVGRELGGQQGLSGDVDAWDHGQWLDGSLAQQHRRFVSTCCENWFNTFEV